MATFQLKQNETLGKSREGFFCAGKCDSRGEWYEVGPVRFSLVEAQSDLVEARGKRRASVEWVDGAKLSDS